MWSFSADKFVFPAPHPQYTKDSLKKHLCWIPWNESVSSEKCNDERYAEGIPCIWLPAARAAGVILFCHGNAEDLGMSFAFVKHMRDQFKMNVLAVEYPGYGLLNHLLPSETGIKEVVLTAFRFVLDELRVAYEQVILFGRSIGSGPATYLASRFPVGGLILVAPFASVREVIRHLVGGMVARAFDERFPNISLIGNVSCPTLFIHGEKDNLVPPSQSVALFKQCRARKLLITPPTMEHNTNLFADASFLAVPAINFFGLPGYQQESPVVMPIRCFDVETCRRTFLRRRGERLKSKEGSGDFRSNPFFFFCGCPTNKAAQRASSIGALEQEPLESPDGREYDEESLASAGREAAAVVAARLGVPTEDVIKSNTESWQEEAHRDAGKKNSGGDVSLMVKKT